MPLSESDWEILLKLNSEKLADELPLVRRAIADFLSLSVETAEIASQRGALCASDHTGGLSFYVEFFYNEDVARTLNELGIEIKNAEGKTPAHIFAQYGLVESLQDLKRAGLDFMTLKNIKDNNGYTVGDYIAKCRESDEYRRDREFSALIQIVPGDGSPYFDFALAKPPQP